MPVKRRKILFRLFHGQKRGAMTSKRAFVVGLASILLVTGIFTAVARPKPAQAQFIPVQMVLDALAAQQRAQKSLWDKLKDVAEKIAKQAEKALKIGGDLAYKNGLRVFLGKIAEDTATWVASGNYGQSPFFVENGNYFEELGNAAAGDYLDTIAKEQFGVSICDPGFAKLQIDVALRVNLDPNFCQENCQKNYDTGLNELSITIPAIPQIAPEFVTMPLGNARNISQALQEEQKKGATTTNILTCRTMEASNSQVDLATCLDRFTHAIDVATSKLKSDQRLCINKCTSAKTRRTTSCTLTKIGQNIQDGIDQSSISASTPLGSAKVTNADLQNAFDGGELPKIFKPTENPLGQFLTFYDESQEAKVEAEKKEKDLIEFGGATPLKALISGAIKTPAFLTQKAAEEGLSTSKASEAETTKTGSPIADAFGIFTNTLTNKLIERIFSKGIADPKAKSLAFNSRENIGSSTGGVAAAKERFASLGQVNLGNGGGIDILSELSACPVDTSTASAQSPSPVSANNCVLESNFRQAIEEHLTVAQALSRRLLSDQKVFGFDANGREPDFRSGYPYRSLKILRKYRIIPVGWELAAQYIRDFERQNVNLSTIVQQFDNPDSPYYRLIDPSWVLKAPENICLRTGFTADVVSQEYVDEDGDEGGRKNIDYTKRYCNVDSDINVGKECNCTTDPADPNGACLSVYNSTTTPQPRDKCVDTTNNSSPKATCALITPREDQIQRREACVDERTCILENDDGTCKQFGTCTEEKDTWRFNGKSCSNVYASCQTYTDSAGQSASYLKNTLQPDSCGADNAGCQQYCTSYDYAASKWTCTNNNIANTVRFDRDAQECDPGAEGCTQFIRMSTGTNLLANGNFEESTIINPAQNASFSGWRTGDSTQTCGAQTFASSQAIGGSQAARLQELPGCAGDAAHYFTNTRDTGLPLRDRTFTVSFYARSEGSACTIETEITTGNEYSPSPNPTITPEWQRFSYSYTFTTAEAARSAFTLFFRPTSACTYLIDNVQVEEGAQLTDYKDYGAVNQAHLKRAPDALGCTGNVQTDPPACSQFVTKCTAADVGCDLFTPTAGGTSVPAKGGISCPADKVGCATFREQPIASVLQAHDTRTGKYCQSSLRAPNFAFVSCTSDAQCGGGAGDCAPLVSFIAKTGTQCSAKDVGCESFTNLDEVAKGGEGKAQFTKLQLCVQPDDPGLQNYYSWVGDNETGYQLKQYRLKQTNVGGSTAPCTNLATGQTLPLNCIDNTNANTQVIDCQATFGTNPDCGQYYDDGGRVFYRLRSRLIEGTADCHPYRNTVDSLVYYADGTKSLSCSAAAVGCREYVGNTGNNTRTLLSSDFENGSYAPWLVNNTNNPSTESITFGGHSLSVTGAAPVAQTFSISYTRGRSYILSFWAKGAAATTIEANLTGTNGTAQLGTAALTTDWNQYTLGPGFIDFDPSGVNGLSITGIPGQNYFLDNITLTEITDSTYRIKASQTACGGFEGCQEYRNRSNVVNTYSGFTKLCKTEVVGCEALVNTRNSTTAFSSTTTFSSQRGDVDGSGRVDSADLDYLNAFLFTGGPAPTPLDSGDVNGDGAPDIGDVNALSAFLNNSGNISSSPYAGDTITTAGDVVEFWVNDPAKACRAEEKGCRAVGKQAFDSKGTLQSMETTYLLDNPDAYATIMCGRGALFCEAYTTPDGGSAYFRNPGNRVCAYRDASGNKSAGWYIEGTETVCPTRELNKIPPAIPNGGYAGLCPAEQSGCGNFLDPLGTGASITTNGNFEVADGSLPQSWTAAFCSNNTGTQCNDDADCGTGTCVESGSVKDYDEKNGSQAVLAVVTGQGTLTQTVSLDANTYYVLSANATKGNAAVTDDFRLGLVSCRNAQGGAVSVSSPDNSMIPDSTGANVRVPANRFTDTTALRLSGRFYSGTAVTCGIIAGAVGGTTGYWVDDVMLNATTSTSVIRQSVDATSCNGQVGDKLGCRLFNDLSNTTLTYDVDQSPISGSPTDPDATGSPSSCADHPELCDSNTLLKVERDRQCTQWLAPTTTIESTKPNGQKENLTLGLATCDSFSPSGQCNHYVDEMRCSNKPKQTCLVDADCGATGGVCKPMPLTGNTQAYSREDLRNKSGLVVAGLQWANNQLVKGKFPFGVAPQIGNDGVAVPNDVLNGEFNETTSLAGSGWTLQADSATDGSVLAVKTSQTLDVGSTTAPVSVNPYLQVTPSIGGNRPTVVRTTPDALANHITSGRTYALSFSIRYVQSPERTVTDTQVSAGIASSATAGITSTNAWFGKVTPSTQWQRFVIGPLTLSADATQAQGNTAAPGTHQPFDQSTGMVYFLLPGGNRTMIAIDDVSLLPVLNVDDPLPASTAGIAGQLNNEAFIARTCRAYPNSTALSCSYQDDTGKRFDGWEGYCLEVDPRNPTGCLTWYPVDLLSGERNIFGRVEAAGYTGQNPLYMCLQGKGATDDDTPAQLQLSGDVDNNYIKYITRQNQFNEEGGQASMAISGVNLSMIQGIRVYVRDSNRGYPSTGSVYVMDRLGGDISCSNASDCPFTGTRYGAEPWFVGGCSTDGHNNGTARCSTEYSWNGFVGGFSEDGSDGWDGDADATTMWAVNMVWDANGTGGTLRFGMNDAASQNGGTGHLDIVVQFIQRDSCQVVAQVVRPGGVNASWANRTASTTYALPDFRYFSSQDKSPYGAIVPPEVHLEEPTLWDTRDDSIEPGRQSVYVMGATQDVRAASVYGCTAGGNCSRRICSRTGSACNTLAEMSACTAARGFCIGAGTAKTCQSGTKLGQACTTDAMCGTAGEQCNYGMTQNLGGGAYATNRPTTTGIAYLKLLFADVYGAWQLNESTQTYADVTNTDTRITNWHANYLNMPICGGIYDRSKANVTSSNQTDLTNAYCGVLPEVVNVKIGNRQTGSTIFVNTGELIQLQFNTLADKEQLPLKNIAIDWDGDSDQDEIIPWNFAPRSDPADPHSVAHVYRFGVDAGECFTKGTGKYGDKNSPDYNGIVSGKEYCIARPRIQIQDNWDWCNGGRCVNDNAPYSYNFPSTQSSYWEPLPEEVVVIR